MPIFRRSIALKMLASFLGICLLAVAIPILGGHWLVQRGVDYFQQEQNQFRSKVLYDYFLAQYQVENNWDFLQEKEPLRGLAADSVPQEMVAGYRLFFPTQVVTKSPDFDFHGPWWMRTLFNAAIYDADGQFIAGNRARSDKAVQTPFVVTQNGKDEVVGYLYKLPEFYFSPDQNQAQVILAILGGLGSLAALVCALAVWLLARHFRAPILHINAASRELAQGHFSVRVGGKAAERPDELGELAQHFNSMAQSLERYEQQRSRMVADISHELRTPLTVMLGTIQGMRAGILPINEENLTPLADAVEGLNHLVEDLRSLSLMEADFLTCSPDTVCPAELARSVAAVFMAAMERQNLRLDVDLNAVSAIRLSGDAARLRQVFQNLLHNALRYTQPPGVVRLSGFSDHENVVFVVENTAPCPSPDQLSQLFERFYRCEQSRSRHSGGSGLGLAISREIITLHGGHIEADQSPMGGLRITLSLPVVCPNCPG